MLPLPIIGAGISAAGQLLGGLFGSKEDTKTTTEVDYVAMARNAEKAGFNPLTAMRNGGSAGFVTTHAPAMSAWSGVGPAMNTLGNALMSFDPQAEKRANLEYKIAEATLANIQSQTEKRMWSMDVPTYAGSTRVSGTGGGSPPAGATAAVKPGDFIPGNPAAPTYTNPYGPGAVIATNVMDAQSWTQRLGEGELLETLLFVGIGGADLAANARKHLNVKPRNKLKGKDPLYKYRNWDFKGGSSFTEPSPSRFGR